MGTCLKCLKSGHHIRDCSLKPSPEEQKRVIAQYKLTKPNKPEASSHYIQLSKISAEDSNASRFVNVIMANGTFSCKGILDSGADATIISRRIINELHSLNIDLNLMSLNELRILKLPNGNTAQIKQSVEIELTLETKLGKLIIPHQKCLI